MDNDKTLIVWYMYVVVYWCIWVIKKKKLAIPVFYVIAFTSKPFNLAGVMLYYEWSLYVKHSVLSDAFGFTHYIYISLCIKGFQIVLDNKVMRE